MNQTKNQWIDTWKTQSETLTKLYQEKRYQETEPIMDEQSELFLEQLFDLNDQNWSKDRQLKDVELLDHQPINCYERIDYVRANLTQYHAFIQLDALYEELAKLSAKVAILKKRDK